MKKNEVIRDYNASAALYDERYFEEQSLKISFILKKVRPGKGQVVIDVGCGTGLLIRCLKEGGFHVGVDSSLQMLKLAKEKGMDAEFVLGDAESLPFRDNCCDVFYSVSVFQLLKYPRRGIEEMLRVLKVGGSYAASLLLKSENARTAAKFLTGTCSESYESESMKDIFLIGGKTQTG